MLECERISLRQICFLTTTIGFPVLGTKITAGHLGLIKLKYLYLNIYLCVISSTWPTFMQSVTAYTTIQ